MLTLSRPFFPHLTDEEKAVKKLPWIPRKALKTAFVSVVFISKPTKREFVFEEYQQVFIEYQGFWGKRRKVLYDEKRVPFGNSTMTDGCLSVKKHVRAYIKNLN